jgi:hypothetical protein
VAAPKLLGAPTIGGGSARSRVVVEGVIEVKKAFQAARNMQKRRKNGRFRARFV